MMQDLVKEHLYVRELTASLVKAGDDYAAGDRDALGRIASHLMSLIEFYPQHMAKEDKLFFPVAMEYLTDGEQAAMLARFLEFDRCMIHEKYTAVVRDLETDT